MNRLFGRGKPKEPPPNLTDAISNVSRGTIFADENRGIQQTRASDFRFPLHLSLNFLLLLRWTVEGNL